MSKEKIKIQVTKKEICVTCISIATYRKCQDCRKPKCILCICKCKPIKDSHIKNKKSVTKPIKKSKKRLDQK